MKRIVSFILLCVLATSVYSQRSAKINRSWLEPVPGGLKIHVNMDIDGCQYFTTEVVCFFYFEDGRKVYSCDNSYKAGDRQVCTSTNVTSRYQSSHWDDVKLWIPNNQITDNRYVGKFKCCVQVFYGHILIGESEYMYFNFY